MTLLRRWSPLLIVIIIFAVSYVSTIMPPWWSMFVRFVMFYSILGLLVWGFLRFGEAAYQAQQQLREHRDEIIEMIHTRSSDLQELRATAAALAERTASIAAATALAVTEASAEKLNSIEATGEETNAMVKAAKDVEVPPS